MTKSVDSSVSSGAVPVFHVNAHCIDFVDGDAEKFYVGAEDFNIYKC